MEKISFQNVFQVLPSAHRVALGARGFRNHQLTGLIWANNHVPSIFRHPLVRGHLFLSQGLLLPGMNFLSTLFLADWSPPHVFLYFHNPGFSGTISEVQEDHSPLI